MNTCDILSKSTVAKSDIKKLIQKTYYTNKKENYGIICLHGNTASLENVGVGEREHIDTAKLHFSCSGGAQKLAEIHTHPGRNLLLSEGDVLDSFRRKTDTVCIAVETENKDNRIKCHTIKDEHKNTRIYVDDLKKDIEQIIKRYREADKNVMKAIHTGDDKLISDAKLEAKKAEKDIKDRYYPKAEELHSLMKKSVNWFDYCELKL